MEDEWWFELHDSLKSSTQPLGETVSGVEKTGTGALYWMEDDRWMMCRVEKTGKMLRADVGEIFKAESRMVLHFKSFTLPVGVKPTPPPKRPRPVDQPPEPEGTPPKKMPRVEPVPGPEPGEEGELSLEVLAEAAVRAATEAAILLKVDELWFPSPSNTQKISRMIESSPYMQNLVRGYIAHQASVTRCWNRLFGISPPRDFLTRLGFPEPTTLWYDHYLITGKIFISSIHAFKSVIDTLNEIGRNYVRNIIQSMPNPIKEASTIRDKLHDNYLFKDRAVNIDDQKEPGFNDPGIGMAFFIQNKQVTVKGKGLYTRFTLLIKISNTSTTELIKVIPMNIMILPRICLVHLKGIIDNEWSIEERHPPSTIIALSKRQQQGLSLHRHFKPLYPTILQLQPHPENARPQIGTVRITSGHLDQHFWDVLASQNITSFEAIDVAIEPMHLSNIQIAAHDFTIKYGRYAPGARSINLDFPNARRVAITQDVGMHGVETVIHSLRLGWFEAKIREHMQLSDEEKQLEEATWIENHPTIFFNAVSMTAATLAYIAVLINNWKWSLPINMTMRYKERISEFAVIPYITNHIHLPTFKILNTTTAQEITDIVAEMTSVDLITQPSSLDE